MQVRCQGCWIYDARDYAQDKKAANEPRVEFPPCQSHRSTAEHSERSPAGRSATVGSWAPAQPARQVGWGGWGGVGVGWIPRVYFAAIPRDVGFEGFEFFDFVHGTGGFLIGREAHAGSYRFRTLKRVRVRCQGWGGCQTSSLLSNGSVLYRDFLSVA